LAGQRYNPAVITLAENEERLVEALRALPPDVSDHVMAWIARLRELGNGNTVEWSDSWTEEDLADVQRASLSKFDQHGSPEV
jgi:hypothetical protein